MQFRYWIILLFIAGNNRLISQNWQALDTGLISSPIGLYSDSAFLYAGLFTGGPPTPHPLRKWNGSQWDTLGTKCIGQSLQSVGSMVTYQGKLTAARSCGIFQWDGNSWLPLATDAGGYLHVLNDTLYATGLFDTIGGIAASCIAKFDGTSWSAIDTTKWYGGAIRDAILYQGDLYIGGNVYNWNGTMYNLAKWNGVQWQSVGGNAMAGGMSSVTCFHIYNNELFIGGAFSVPEGNPGNAIVKWDGTQWDDVGGGMSSMNADVLDMVIYNGELYAVGGFLNAGGVPAKGIAKWDGTKWCGFGDDYDIGGPLNIEKYQNELYIGGGFRTIDGDTMNYIAKWIGGNYTDTCGTTGRIDVNDFSSLVDILPNPATQFITVSTFVKTSELLSITIFSVDGRIMYEEKAGMQYGEFTRQIDISQYPDGMYFLQVAVGDKMVNKKIIKL